MLDPEEVADAMARLKVAASREIEACGGMVNQFVGDQVMGLFGVPVAHDDDPIRAVRAALAIHEFMSGFSVEFEPRIGQALAFHTAVSTGLVVAQHRDRRDGEYAVTGDAVNTGARIVSIAKPDEILLGPDTYHAVRRYFETDALGLIELRGKSEPVQIHRVRGVLVRSHFDASRRQGLSRFVGRKREMATFRDLLSDLSRGKASVLTLRGDPGVGKSRLFHEFEALVRAEGIDALAARCESFGTVAPFAPFAQLLRERIGLTEDLEHDAMVERAETHLEALGPGLSADLPVLFHILSLRSDSHPLPASLRGEALQEASFRALGCWIGAETRRAPLAVFLEDWHWAEFSSQLALRHLMLELPRWPLLLCINYRSHYSPDFVPGCTELELPAFDAEEASELIGSLLEGDRPDDDRVEEIRARADGNPFFIEELCRELREVRDAGAGGSREPGWLPETVEAVVRARVDRLDPIASRVMRVAAALGVQFRRVLLQQWFEVDDDLDAALHSLQRAGLLVAVPGSDEATYRFKHAITREVVYEMLLHRDRRSLHRRIGVVLEETYPGDLREAHYEAIAHHFTLGDDPEKAIAYLELAGDKASQSFAMPSALTHYAKAVSLLKKLEQTSQRSIRWVDMVFRWSQAGWWGPSIEQIEALEEAREISAKLGDPKRELLSVYFGGWLLHAMGDSTQAAIRFQRCLRGIDPADDRLRARLYCDLGMSLANASDYEGGLEHLRRGIELRRSAYPDRWETPAIAYALAFVAVIVADRGDFEMFDREMRNAVEIAERFGVRTALSSINQMRIIGDTYRGDWKSGMAHGRDGCELANAIGAKTNHGMARTLEGWCSFRGEGDLAGIDAMREGLAEMEAYGTRLGISLYYAYLAEALARVDRLEAATVEVGRALERDAAGDRYGQAAAHRAMALIASKRGDREAVGQALERARRSGAEKQSLRELALCDLAEAECRLLLGETDATRAKAQAAVVELERMKLPWFAALARQILDDVGASR